MFHCHRSSSFTRLSFERRLMISHLLKRPGDGRVILLKSHRQAALRRRLRSRSHFRDVLAVTTSVTTDKNVDGGESTNSHRRRSNSPRSRMRAVAEKISAARELARKLAEEKQAAIHSGQQYNERILKSTEAAAMEAAIHAAEADSMNRALHAAELGRQKEAEIRYLKKLNKSLSEMVLELASDKRNARQRLNSLLSEYQQSDIDIELELELELEEEEEEMVVVEEEEEEWEEELEEQELYEEEIESDETSKEIIHLQQSCQTALESDQRFFTVPTQPTVGRLFRFLYNRLSGPLPETSRLSLKYGLNKWEEIREIEMQRSEALREIEGEWWEVEFTLEPLLYRCDFVVVDQASGLVDNNDSKDFVLSFKGGLTKKELLEKRLEIFEANEDRRNEEFDREIKSMTEEAESKAQGLIQEAKSKLLSDWGQYLNSEAQSSIQSQRSEGLKALSNAEVTLQSSQVAWFGPMSPGSIILVAYNSSVGPLAGSESIRIHLGVDNWYNEEITILELKPLSPGDLEQLKIEEEFGDGNWLGAKFRIPESAVVFNYVFDDGRSVNWDNNNGKDYLTPVNDPRTEDELVAARKSQLEEEHYQDLQKRLAEAEATIRQRIMAKLESRIRRWKAQWKYLYTNPVRIKAGDEIELWYRPDLTVLRGRPDVYVKVGFNNWKHQIQIPFTRLEPMFNGGISFHKVNITIPEDAYVLDFIFSDSDHDHGGFIDNNSGLDYHMPITGSKLKSPSLKIVHVTVEMAPIAKVGGLADVVTALGRAVQEEGHEVQVILPKYDCIDYSAVSDLRQELNFDYRGSNIQVWNGVVEDLKVTFLEPNNGFFWVGCIYGRYDDAHRFDFFCGAAAEYLRIFNIAPNVVHCHDWQTAPVVWSDLAGAKTVFTIHNMNYGVDLIGRAMQSTAIATTVSPTYAAEISGSPAIESNLNKLYGILNGIDIDIWDPARDRLLPVNYTQETVIEGKRKVRMELRQRLNLAQIDVPIVGVVTRLTPQKGIHLIKHAARRTLERGGQFVLLASDLKNQYPDRAAMLFAYDEPMSHLIFAGCDLFLVPSMFEPCGLTQLIAMRYGTVPIVRKTGGLNDTVFDVDTDIERATDKGVDTNGFNFEGVDEVGMDYALNRALGFFFNDRSSWNELCQRVMQQDWSWSIPAMDYLQLYFKAVD
eukprot:g6788.t1